MAESLTLEATINNQSVAGKIYVMHNTLYGDQIVAQAQNNGALAVIEIAAKYCKPFKPFNNDSNLLKYRIIKNIFELMCFNFSRQRIHALPIHGSRSS